MSKFKSESHLSINDTIHTAENMPVLAQRLQDTLNAHTLQFGKIQSAHGRHFYLYVTDEQLKEWKVKVAIRELRPSESVTTSVHLAMDLERAYDREQSINQSVVITLWSTHKAETYTRNQYAIGYHIGILETIATAFPFAKDTNHNALYENGMRLELTPEQLRKQLDNRKRKDND